MLEAEALAARVQSLVKKVRRRVAAWVDDPSERNTHDVRTAVRRLRSAIELLPKRVRRRPRTVRFLGLCREVFRACSALRDADVLSAKIASMPESIAEQLEETVGEGRHGKLRDAHAAGTALLGAKPPRVRPRDLDRERVLARLAKVAGQESRKVRTLLPTVIADEGRIEALHTARKACKSLRYTYEIVGDDPSAPRMAWTRALQDVLGDLHDRDVMLAALGAPPPATEVTRAMALERAERCAKHEELATFVRQTPDLLSTIAPFP